jgi:hypothetical protein
MNNLRPVKLRKFEPGGKTECPTGKFPYTYQKGMMKVTECLTVEEFNRMVSGERVSQIIQGEKDKGKNIAQTELKNRVQGDIRTNNNIKSEKQILQEQTSRQNRNTSQISTAQEEPSVIDRTLDVISHPTEAFSYLVQGRDLPTRMSGSNPYDMVFGFPGQVIRSGKNLLGAAFSPIETGKTIVAAGTNLLTNTLFQENLFDESYNNKAIGLGLDLLNVAGGRMVGKDFLRLYDRNFNKIGRELAQIEREGLEKGLSSKEIIADQVKKTGIYPMDRAPSSSFYRDVTPRFLINSVKSSNSPLVNSIPALFTTPGNDLKVKYAQALTWGLLDRMGKPVNAVLPKLYKDLAYTIGSQSLGASRSLSSILQGTANRLLGKSTGTYTGVSDKVGAEGLGMGKRNLLKNYIYGNTSGFDASDIQHRYLDEYIKQYGPLKTYRTLTENYHFPDAPFDNNEFVAREFLLNNNFRNYLKNNYSTFSEIDPVISDTEKLSMIYNNTGIPKDVASLISLPADAQSFMYSDYLSKNPILRISREHPTATGVLDDIAGHQVFYTLDPKTNQIMRQSQDIWKFAPKGYSNRYQNAIGSSGLDAGKILNRYIMNKQASLLERSGKPFILQDFRPLDLKTNQSFFANLKEPKIKLNLNKNK